MLTIGSLFSGIGGLELGLERASLGAVQWQVEIDPYCRLVLARHFPHVPRFTDVRSVGAASNGHPYALTPVDLICGGSPCQGLSSAGKRKGFADPRSGLWSEFARVVSELRPRLVLVENVASGRSRFLPRVLGDLAALGYDAEWDCIGARDVGAPHERDRLFILGWRCDGSTWDTPSFVSTPNAQQQQLRNESRWSSGKNGTDQAVTSIDGGAQSVANNNNNNNRGNEEARLPARSDGPRLADTHGRGRSGLDAHLDEPMATDTAATAQQQQQGLSFGSCLGHFAREELQTAGRNARGVGGTWMAQSGLGGAVHGLPGGMDGAYPAEPWERGVPRVVPSGRPKHEKAIHEARLVALGNTVVPQVAEFIGRRIVACLSGQLFGGRTIAAAGGY
jgi:DNA (cytosine-5)-methyltransferase 1